jgi:hypothetical protein
MYDVFCSHTWEILRPHVGALFLRCEGTTFALRLTNDFEEKIADLCCAAVLQFELPSPHTKK